MNEIEKSKSFALQFERILEIDRIIRNNTFPTTKKLAEKFGITERQIQRLIKMMQEDLEAPIQKNPEKNNGFYYGLEGYSITNISYNENETFALHFCNNFVRRTLIGSGISKRIENGLTTLQNLSETYDNDEGTKLANRIHFAMDTSRLNHSLVSKQENFEDALLNSIKEGQMMKISIKNWDDDSVTQDVGLPLFIAMHEDFWWILVYIKKEAFLDDFTSVKKIVLNSINIVKISDISSIDVYKNSSAKQVLIKNNFSFIGESPISSIQNLSEKGVQEGIGLCFSISFLDFQKEKTYKIFAHFIVDDENLTYKLDTSPEYEILDGVFPEGEGNFQDF